MIKIWPTRPLKMYKNQISKLLKRKVIDKKKYGEAFCMYLNKTIVRFIGSNIKMMNYIVPIIYLLWILSKNK